MYNRYIPQQDGSHRRNRVEEPHSAPPAASPPSPQPTQTFSHPPHPEPIHGNALGFLRQLLPKNFDTGDLIVVLLLLLMAGDKPEDKNTALLTLALYCFL